MSVIFKAVPQYIEVVTVGNEAFSDLEVNVFLSKETQSPWTCLHSMVGIVYLQLMVLIYLQ